MSDHIDRFRAAVRVLAGQGHIKQRLIQAYEEHLDGIDDDGLPFAVKEAFADIKYAMYRVPPLAGESPIRGSVRKMSLSEASECSVSVVNLYDELLQTDGGLAAPTVIVNNEDSAQPVPPFLLKSV